MLKSSIYECSCRLFICLIVRCDRTNPTFSYSSFWFESTPHNLNNYDSRVIVIVDTEVTMAKKVPPQELAKIFKKNKPTGDIYLIAMHVPQLGDVAFVVRWYDHLRSFAAMPIHQDQTGELFSITVTLPGWLHRRIRKRLKREFYLRHRLNIRTKQRISGSEKRILALMPHIQQL